MKFKRPVTTTLSLLLFALTVSLLAMSIPQKVHAATNGKIVFTRQTGNGATNNIYMMNADGGGQVALTSDNVSALPAFSPDRTRIAFTKNSMSGQLDIYTMRTDGSDLTRLTFLNLGSSSQDPEWSPDGTKIVFASDRNGFGISQIFTMKADGSEQTVISTDLNHRDEKPDWSPDGTKIVFTSRRTGQSNIFTMSPNGTNVSQLTFNSTVGQYFAPAWSPDGTKIAYSFNSGSGTNYSLNRMDANGTNIVGIGESSLNRTYAAWSPDGTKVVYTAESPAPAQLHTLRSSDGGADTNLSNSTTTDFSPDWASAEAALDGVKIDDSGVSEGGTSGVGWGGNCYSSNSGTPCGTNSLASYPFSDDCVKIDNGGCQTTNFFSISGIAPGSHTISVTPSGTANGSWNVRGWSICEDSAGCTTQYLTQTGNITAGTSFSHNFGTGKTYHMRWIFNTASARQIVHRLYNPKTYMHLWTTTQADIDAAIRYGGYSYEGIAFYVPTANTPGAVLVHRLYNPKTFVHFWTITQADIDAAIRYGGYSYEGVAYSALPTTNPPAGSVAIHRLYNPKTYLHLWTAHQADIDNAIKNAGYHYEGVAYYGYLTGE